MMNGGVLKFLMFGLIISGTAIHGADERPLVPENESILVQYQIKNVKSNAWSSSSATLKGATSESMMINTLSARHPGAEIRILSAAISGRNQRVKVRYQLRRSQSAWGTANAALTNVLTETMARNQLSIRHPGAEIRILSMVKE